MLRDEIHIPAELELEKVLPVLYHLGSAPKDFSEKIQGCKVLD